MCFALRLHEAVADVLQCIDYFLIVAIVLLLLQGTKSDY
jgi:hypothetical protein